VIEPEPTPHPRPVDPSLVGRLVELDIGAVAHGGHCVARLGDAPGGRVVFVRHALPGERARVLVTEDGGGSYVRGDAVEILRSAPDRVNPPCPHAGPGRCGGCDWQHVRPAATRDLKADVVREQFARLAGIEVEVTVSELAGGPLHWRTRIDYAIDAAGRPGLRKHRSHEVVPIDSCPLGTSGVGDSPALTRTWPGEARIEVVRDDDGNDCVLAERVISPLDTLDPRSHRRGSRPPRPGRRARPAPLRLVSGAERLRHTIVGANAAEIKFEVAPGGFWQVHPAAAQTFVTAVLRGLAPRSGDVVLDLYAGAGLFTAVFAHAVGPAGRVVGIEADAQAVTDANLNLQATEWAAVRRAPVEVSLVQHLDLGPDLIILDPPRTGAGPATMRALLALGARAIAYVACDPAALARDVRVALDGGWRLQELSAYDAFPMTHHVECIAILTRS
jgi:tRNA/tmRNA/rRNA uracil-C5-methylase (TrmA/RlmC/RlmD family)